MFYSHTFLARKSPLGTVWIAAHLERRIKKPQIDGIDIPSYADFIMFPEVPIALRLSGHLLLGLVRIYSWKVNYLFQDCNRMRTEFMTVFTSLQVDLPTDADHAPFETVTKPDTFDLDAVELDESHLTTGPDNHLKTYDQITIEDRSPPEGEQYVTIVMNEDDRINTSLSRRRLNLDSVIMEEDVFPPFEDRLDDLVTPLENVPDARDPGPSNQAGVSIQIYNEGSLSHDFPEIEVMRDAVHNSETEVLPELHDMLPDIGLHEQSAPSTNRKDVLSPIMEGQSISGEISLSMPANDEVPTGALADERDILNTGISLGQEFPDVQLQPSPPVQQNAVPPVQQNRARNRKRQRNVYDVDIVLSNAEMKKQLEDTSKLVCKRRKLPDTVLDLWRYRRTTDDIFVEPSISGMCADLQGVYKRTIPLRPESTPITAHVPGNVPEIEPSVPDIEMEPAIPETEVERGPHGTEMEADIHHSEIELEHPRFGGNEDVFISDLMPSPSTVQEFTPTGADNLGSASDKGKTFETEVLPTFDIPASEAVGPQLGTPSVNREELLHLDDTSPREIPSLLNSADVEELNFLEASNESSGSDAVKVGNLSVRTRAVAQFFKERSPTSQASEEQSESLSLNRILEGKTRKQCARMFFETLVLKTYDLIDVRQEEAYGDIQISPTPALSSAKF